jgi:aminopeptidase N
VKYDLTLTPNLTSFTFQGEETIDIEVAQPTAQIMLNATELQIQAVQLTLADGSVLSPTKID